MGLNRTAKINYGHMCLR